jgi:hypothetical protein
MQNSAIANRFTLRLREGANLFFAELIAEEAKGFWPGRRQSLQPRAAGS